MTGAQHKRLQKKIDELIDALRQKKSVAVALSGGVDSSLVAMLAYKALGEKASAITVNSPLLPSGDINVARKTAKEIGIEHIVLELNELDIAGFSTNPPDRCYLCKRFRFATLKKRANEMGFRVVADGTTYSDLSEYRPGIRILKELDVYSPLLQAKITKQQTRSIGDLLGLSTANKPANTCLATRIPYGEFLEPARLKRIDSAEVYVRNLTGVKTLRIRDHGNLARIEVGKNEIKQLLNSDVMGKISQQLRGLGYDFVTLDLEGYRPGIFDHRFQGK